MKNRLWKLFASAAFSLLVLQVPASAQWVDALGGTWNNPVSSSITQILMNRMSDRMVRRRIDGNRGTNVKPDPSNSRSEAAPDSSITPAIRQQINAVVTFRSSSVGITLDNIVGVISSDRQEQAQMKAIMKEVLESFNTEASKNGYKNDLALAFSSFIAMNSAAYHGTELPADEKVIELRDAIAQVFYETNALKGVTDAKKQEMYETLIIFAGVAYASFLEAKASGNTGGVTVYRELAAQNVKAVFGLDAENLKFTDDGLDIKQK